MGENKTIAAIASGMTDAGIGIIRVSGNEAIEIVNRIFKPAKKKDLLSIDSYQATYGHIVEQDDVIDEVIVLVMKAPATYTREDTVEINCHGGIIVMKRVLEVVLGAGAAIAEPGEFTKRAFLNGRIDLTQAESVMDIIHAKNNFSIKASMMQLRGDLSDKIVEIREKILYHIAFIESALDDPEHYSLDDYPEKLTKELLDMNEKISSLITSSDNGRILKEGIKTVIVGKPNAGKSSIMNVLLGEDRAIVTDIAGTTRDTLEEAVSIEGIPLNIVDTAGIRDTQDVVEKIGVDKAKSNLQDADLILYVVDASVPLDENDEEIIAKIKNKNVIILLNKQDLNIVVDKMFITSLLDKEIVEISTKTKAGIDDLYEVLKKMFFKGDINFNDEIYITNMRHKEALMNAKQALDGVKESIDNGMPEDFFSIDLMRAYEELGFIIGEAVEDDLVNKIFKEFCMGK